MESVLSVKNLSKTYKSGFRALKGISFEVRQGDFLALLGPNGAGKSTTIGIISSLVNKTGGSVNLFGIDIDKDFPSAKEKLGIVPQEFNFSLFEKVGDILISQGGYFGLPPRITRKRAEKYLKLLGLWEKRDNQSRLLSGGMKRRLMIARALVHEPGLLILDEPTAGVDIELRRSMWDFLSDLNKSGTTIILTTHYLEEAERLCRTIAIIDRGKIVENTRMKELISKLDHETLVLDLEVESPGPIRIPNYTTRSPDSLTLEVDINGERSLNDLFLALEAKGIRVKSLRNKTNRLEELFVSLVKPNQPSNQ